MSPRMIIDVGMHNGDDTAYYLKLGFRVIAIEANPILVEQGRQRFAQAMADGRLEILNVGIAPQKGELPFWVCENPSEWSSFDRNIASRDGAICHAITVQTKAFREILEEQGTPHYLKIDIEGYDGLCLDALEGAPLPDYLSIEANGTDYLQRLHGLGYRRFKCISQFKLLPVEDPPAKEEQHHRWAERMLYDRNPIVRILRRCGGRAWLNRQLTLTQTDGAWRFTPGSTGRFGERSPGRWQTYEEMLSTYQLCQAQMQRGMESLFWNEKGYSFWTDFHARKG